MRRMVEMAKKAVALSFLSQKHYFAAGPYHFTDPEKVKYLLENEFRVTVKIVHDDQLKGESCVFVYKN